MSQVAALDRAERERTRRREWERKNKLNDTKRIRLEVSYNPEEAPPDYVLREREIRSQILHDTYTARACGDPLPGYTAKDNKARRLSVQDALEIRALYTTADRPIISRAYSVDGATILQIITGQWFERLLPNHKHFDPGL
jgi:hypothetical protein